MVLYAGGQLNDVGFEQFSAGGTELVNDVGPFNAGNNFCIGAWKQVGPRSYDVVHPFFLFDGNNAIGVSIERAHFLVSQGNVASGPYQVVFKFVEADNLNHTAAPQQTISRSALASGGQDSATAPVTLHIKEPTVRINAFLMVNNQQVDQAFLDG
jgi:hypothetical protein